MRNKMKFLAVPLAAVLTLALSTSVAAAEKKGSPFKNLVMKMIGYTKKTAGYTKKTVEKEVNTVGTGIKKGADVVIKEVKNIGSLATGDTSKAKDVLVKPVEGMTEVVGETAYGAVNAPIEAGKEVAEEEIK